MHSISLYLDKSTDQQQLQSLSTHTYSSLTQITTSFLSFPKILCLKHLKQTLSVNRFYLLETMRLGQRRLTVHLLKGTTESFNQNLQRFMIHCFAICIIFYVWTCYSPKASFAAYRSSFSYLSSLYTTRSFYSDDDSYSLLLCPVKHYFTSCSTDWWKGWEMWDQQSKNLMRQFVLEEILSKSTADSNYSSIGWVVYLKRQDSTSHMYSMCFTKYLGNSALSLDSYFLHQGQQRIILALYSRFLKLGYSVSVSPSEGIIFSIEEEYLYPILRKALQICFLSDLQFWRAMSIFSIRKGSKEGSLIFDSAMLQQAYLLIIVLFYLRHISRVYRSSFDRCIARSSFIDFKDTSLTSSCSSFSMYIIICFRSYSLRQSLKTIKHLRQFVLIWWYSSSSICRNSPFVQETSRTNLYFSIIFGIVLRKVQSHSRPPFCPNSARAAMELRRMSKSKDLICSARKAMRHDCSDLLGLS